MTKGADMDIRRILLAVDTSSASMRAVEYVGDFLRGSNDCFVELLHVSRKPDRDLFPDDSSMDKRMTEQEGEAERFLSLAYDMLVDRGLKPEHLGRRSLCVESVTVSETILDIVREGGFGTLAVGRRGVSKQEEFLYGSVSSGVVQGGSNCCVWVVG